MKRWMIWAICLTMGICFVILLYLQLKYAKSMMTIRREQFNESVFRSLDAASRNLERNETMVYLRDVVAMYGDTLDAYSSAYTMDVTMSGMRTFQQRIRNAYIYEREVLDEVVLRVLYASGSQRFDERIDKEFLRQSILHSLRDNGINLTFHYRIFNSEGKEVYRCPDYEAEGEDYSYSQTLFRNDPSGKMGLVSIHFPSLNNYVLEVANMIYLALLFTIFLFITFLITVYLVVRQKKVTELKNDFINNMTHEFKTPISTISIAAQMLTDPNLQKTQEMYERFGGVIYGETKRLRYQVEKVLQTSLYEGGNIALHKQLLNANDLIDGVVQTFNIKVSQSGGKIDARLEALNPDIEVDEMHFTNVIFNLMDNAVKYKRDDVDLHLEVSTWNSANNLCVQISDNGLGIRKEDLKRIFDKFYRVHTGNTHNVKGFGLGLAYVKAMIEQHKGTIKASSEYGKGTVFTITIPQNNK
ncbi:MAG: HAMP domain-containing histidine kinase [Bacteroidaceae bacterium]|nr:HAMP domain-containing histidine kinase [Bacteroidaceae bacterium]